MIPIYSLIEYMKGDKSYDSRITFQTEIQRHLRLIQPKPDVPIEWQEPTPGQITEKQLQLHFPSSKEKIETGTLDDLIGLSCVSPDVFRDFIWGHRLFVTTQEVLFQFLQRFEIAASINCSLSKIIKARIVSILSYWSNTIFPLLPEQEKQDALKLFRIFLIRMKDYGMKKQATLLENQLCREKIIFLPTENDVEQPRLPFNYLLNKTDINFIDIPSKDFSKQLTLITSYYFRCVELFELFLWNKCKDECKALSQCVKIFNSLQNYFSVLLLNEKNVNKRSYILCHIINIAFDCYEMQNFDIVVCVITLFSTSSIHRLHKTFELLPKSVEKKLNILSEFASPENNWANYRKKIENAKHTACVPYVGLFLSDMLFTTDGIKTQTEDKLINFVKCQKLSAIAQKVSSLQQKLYPFKSNDIIQKFIKSIFDVELTKENDKFQLSRKIEPQDGKEKVVEVFDPLNNKFILRNDLVKVTVIIKNIKRIFYVDPVMNIQDLFLNWIGINETVLNEKRIVVVNKEEIINISPFSVIADIQRRFLKPNGCITLLQNTLNIKIRNVNDELNVPLDISLSMDELCPLISVLFDIEIHHCFIHLLNGKPDIFIPMHVPLDSYLTDISSILLLPYSSFSPNIKESFLTSSYFYRYDVMVGNKPLQLIHAHPFLILKHPDFIETIHSSVLKLVYLPLSYELHLIAEGTKHSKDSPLIINCSNELCHKLITLYHHSSAICGIDVEYLQSNLMGLHQLFYDLCYAIYLNPSFYKDDFFTNFDVTNASQLLYKCELCEQTDLLHCESSSLVGALFLYLTSLEKPLFGHLYGDLLSIQNTFLDDENLITISKKLLKSIDGTMALSITRALIILFNSWIKVNPYNISSLAHFSKFFVCEIAPDSQLRLFNYLIQHLNELDLTPNNPTQYPSLTPHNLSVDYIIRSIFDDIDYKPTTTKDIVERPLNENRTFITKKTTFKKLNLSPPRIRSMIKIGDRKSSTPRMTHFESGVVF